ncbi:AEC family transporter [Mycoplasmopsis columbinasalis]|uniref:Auxin efflux carrier n=1 Tax=Mycoplasmopsis columbinasalis TaxID=114880 RepID=A0A449BAU0_9BACT|nr:AEC family transporter [Mycoplasmopsis columbinasalis]VEU78307.1 auxin efflux carrier [Mycoplasmopsis columbinasalis]
MNFVKVLTNTSFWGAIVATVVIISLGFILTKTKVLKVEFKKVLNAVVLKIALPAVAFIGFMKKVTVADLTNEGIILGVSFAFYILLCLAVFLFVKYGSRIIPSRMKKNPDGTVAKSESKALISWMMIIFGSITFFGLPIINVMAKDATTSANIWTIPYRIFLYSYCFMMVSGLKFDKENIKKSLKTTFLNPIVIATFLGLVLYLTQLIPGASGFAANFARSFEDSKTGIIKPGEAGWFQLDVTMPYIHKTINYLSGLASPLVWLSIGITLATSNIKAAAKDWKVWTFSAVKLVVLPLVIFLIFWPLVKIGKVTAQSGLAMVIFAATPPATVVIAYAMQYKVHEEYAAQCSALSTLLAVVLMPIWVAVASAVYGL